GGVRRISCPARTAAAYGSGGARWLQSGRCAQQPASGGRRCGLGRRRITFAQFAARRGRTRGTGGPGLVPTSTTLGLGRVLAGQAAGGTGRRAVSQPCWLALACLSGLAVWPAGLLAESLHLAGSHWVELPAGSRVEPLTLTPAGQAGAFAVQRI